MAFVVTNAFDLATLEYVVTVKVDLTMAETNALFLSGDTIISWPEGNLRQAGEPGPAGQQQGLDSAFPRTGMFVSELARLAHGLEIGYRQATEAERASRLVRFQLLNAGVEEVD